MEDVADRLVVAKTARDYEPVIMRLGSAKRAKAPGIYQAPKLLSIHLVPSHFGAYNPAAFGKIRINSPDSKLLEEKKMTRSIATRYRPGSLSSTFVQRVAPLVILALVVLHAFGVLQPALGQAPIYPNESLYEPIFLDDSDDKNKLRDIGTIEDQRLPGDRSLVAFIRDQNPLIRLRAAQAMHRIGDPEQLQYLIAHAEDPDLRVSLECIFGTGQFKDAAALPVLTTIMKKGKPDQVIETMHALGKIGDHEATPLLTKKLKDFSGEVRFHAALSLALMADSSAVDDLLLALEDDYAPVIWASAYALEKIPHKKATKDLLQLLEHDDELVRSYCARTLGRMKAGKASGAIRTLLEDESWEVRVRAIEALGRLEDGGAVELLVQGLRSKNHHIRRAAADALALIDNSGAKEGLIRALDDPSPAVRSHAGSALAEILESDAVPYLLEQLKDRDRTVVAGAVYEIGRIGRDEDTTLVYQRLHEDPDPLVRSEAARSLGDLGRLSSLPQLILALKDPDWVVRAVVAESIGKMKNERGARPLIEAYRAGKDRTDRDMKVEAVRSLGEIGSPASRDFLRDEAMWDADIRVRELAAQALSAITGAKTVALDDAAWKAAKNWRPSPGSTPFPPLGTHFARIITDKGTIRIKLFGDHAPNTVGIFILRAREGAYDGLTFHRVVPNFVAQGGDPRGDGWGDMGYNIRSEWNRLSYGRGTVGIAHSGKDTGGCQFFITHSPQPHLDGRYTVFGKVVEGQEVVNAIEQGDQFRVEIEE